MMELKSEKSNNLMLLLTLFALTMFVYKDFSIPIILGYGMLSFAILYNAFINDARIIVNGTNTAFVVLCFFQIVEILRSALLGSNDKLLSIPVFILISVFILMSKPIDRSIKNTVNIWLIFCIMLSVYVIVVRFAPGVFWNIVYPRLSLESQIMATNLLAKGYGIAVGANVIIIDYIVAFGVIFLFSAFLMKIGLRGKRIRRLIILLVMLAAMFFVNRKTEMLAVAISCIALAFSKTVTNSSMKRIKNIIMLCVLCSFMIIGMYILYKSGNLGRYGAFIDGIIRKKTSQTVDVSSGRLELWALAFQLFLMKPILGIGWGRFSLYIPEYIQSGLINRMLNAHNCFLQVLCEAGIVGFLIFYICMGYVFIRMIDHARKMNKNNADVGLRLVMITCIGYNLFFFITSAIDPTFYYLIFWCLYATTIMLAEGAYRLSLQKQI